VIELTDKWLLLESQDSRTGYKTLRFEATGPLELFLSVDDGGNHSILIYLPPSYTPKFNAINNDNIELLFIKNGHFLLIRLLDNDFSSLFDDLVISLVDSIRDILDPINASKEFISTYVKWSSFFSKTIEKGLSKERVIGLWGELSYLLDLITNASSGPRVDSILKAWVGPYDAPHDFELPNSSLEIKTKLISSSMVKISSEFQLDNIDNKNLFLTVFSISETELGLSLKDLFVKIKFRVQKLSGDVTLLLAALEKENLDEERLAKYSNLLFARKRKEVFDCDIDSFPKIVSSTLPPAVYSVKYNLDLRELEKYKVSQESY